MIILIGGEFMEPAESGRTVRVMVRKEFMLQPDGTYKESSMDDQNVEFVGPSQMDFDHNEAESAPPLVYAYSPHLHQFGDNVEYDEPQGSASAKQFHQLTADDVQDVMRQLEASYAAQQQNSPQSYNSNSFQLVNQTASASAPPSVRLAYPDFEIKQAPATSYFLDQSQIRSNQGAPNSIQEIIKKPEQKQLSAASAAGSANSHYYSPKENQYHNSFNYDTSGGGGGGGGYDNFEQGHTVAYGGPSGPSEHHLPSPGPSSYGVPDTSFGPSPVPQEAYGVGPTGPDHHHNQWSSSYGNVKHGGGGGGGVVNSLVHTVAGVGQTKAHQVSSILHTKGEVGSQILNQGGKVVQQAVHQKAEKAKIIANTLSHVPAKFSQVLRNKAEFATGFLDQSSRAIGSVLNVKAQVANQASYLLAAKGKAANAVIRAGGSTAADLIVAKGKGIANLITSGGQATAALLNHKGNKVQKIAQVLSGVGGGGYLGGGGGGWGSNDGIVGGYSENEEQYETYPSRVYDERQIQDALKSVVQSPASSYGQAPASSLEDGSQSKLNSAFKSIYNTFKSAQPTQSLFGSYSSPVEVTLKPSSAEQAQPSIGQSATSIGESLTKMSKMLNNVASAINWLKPKTEKEA